MNKTTKIILQVCKYVLLGISVYYLILGDLAVVLMSMFLLAWTILLMQQLTLKYEKNVPDREKIRSQVIDVIFAEKGLEDCPSYKDWSEIDKHWAEEIYIKYKKTICGDE